MPAPAHFGDQHGGAVARDEWPELVAELHHVPHGEELPPLLLLLLVVLRLRSVRHTVSRRRRRRRHCATGRVSDDVARSAAAAAAAIACAVAGVEKLAVMRIVRSASDGKREHARVTTQRLCTRAPTKVGKHLPKRAVHRRPHGAGTLAVWPAVLRTDPGPR